MLVNMNEMLLDAKTRKYAVAAINAPNLETVRAAVEAAEEVGVPLILSHAVVQESMVKMEMIAPIMLAAAKNASVPVAVHLDHGDSFDVCVKAMGLGFTSVMYDASAKSLEQNIEETAQIVRIAKALGVTVEAELGHVFTSTIEGGPGRKPMSEEDFESLEDVYTHPDHAKLFVEQTGVDALAISFGTVHGVYVTEPKLNLERVREIKDKIDIPFVMHGGSGVSDQDTIEAINNGITKINYYTYSAIAGGEAVRKMIHEKGEDRIFYHDVVAVGEAAVKEDIKRAMRVFAYNIL